MSEIFKALAKAQSTFEAALKGAQNPHFRSKYAALDACMDAVRAPLNAQGIFITQPIECVADGVLIETLFCHESGETYSGGKLFMPVVKHDAQGYGSAITYGRRYSLLTACGVAPEDDDGNQATAAKPATTSKAPVIKQPSLQGIGDDLPPDVKNFLLELAESTKELCSAGNAHGALAMLKEQNLEGDQNIYLDRHLPSQVRSALRKAAAEAKETATA